MATGGARYTVVTSEKWEDDWYLGLPIRVRHLFDFLCEGSHGTFAGVFRLSRRTISSKTGRWNDEAITKAAQQLTGHAVFYEDSWTFVVNYLAHNGPENLSYQQALGVISTVKDAPHSCRSDFWSRYHFLLEPHSFSPDTLSIPLSVPTDTTIPFHTIPGQAKNGLKTRAVRTAPSGGELPQALKAKHVELMARWDECWKRYYARNGQPWQGVKATYRDAGHVAKLVADYLRTGSDPDLLARAMWLYFKRRSDFREEKWADTPKGKVPPAVPVLAKDFAVDLHEYVAMAEDGR